MNKFFLLLLTLLFFQCKENVSTKTAKNEVITKKILLEISPSDSLEYNKLVRSKAALSPVQQLCSESKGYVIEEWDILNECSWAVEKYQLNKFSDFASRKEEALSLKTSNNTLTFVHHLEEPTKHYQFIDYLANSKYFVISFLQQSSCLQYWLIPKNGGSKIVLSGQPVFNKTKDAFLVSAGMETSQLNCPKSLTLWQLENGAFKEVSELKTELVPHNLVWQKGMIWLGRTGDELVRIALQ